ncbi:MAG: Sec-independent protein translocase protein TatB [Sphingomonas sp.]
MFDVSPYEFLLVAVVALVVIGPKDLPKAMRVIGYWVGRARGVTRQFREGFDTMMREAELKELEEKWAAENARIMAAHPMADAPAITTAADAAAQSVAMEDSATGEHVETDTESPVQLVPKPYMTPMRDYLLPPSDDEIAAAEGVPVDPPAGSAAA